MCGAPFGKGKREDIMLTTIEWWKASRAVQRTRLGETEQAVLPQSLPSH